MERFTLMLLLVGCGDSGLRELPPDAGPMLDSTALMDAPFDVPS